MCDQSPLTRQSKIRRSALVQSSIRRSTIGNRRSAIDMLPPTIPIFPLPNVVLFPNVFLPLHIFETRYREMLEDALKGDRIIGMVLLRPGWEGNYEGRPPVYPIGCAGVISHAERLPDGRFNIVLRGMEKFRICGEEDDLLYRLAQIEAVPEPPVDSVRAKMQAHRRRLEA